jgi:hypothetical protein
VFPGFLVFNAIPRGQTWIYSPTSMYAQPRSFEPNDVHIFSTPRGD